MCTRFPGRVIFRKSDILTPLDSFLWGYLKNRVYVNHPQTLDDQKVRIRLVIQVIEPAMIQNVIKNMYKRVLSC